MDLAREKLHLENERKMGVKTGKPQIVPVPGKLDSEEEEDEKNEVDQEEIEAGGPKKQDKLRRSFSIGKVHEPILSKPEDMHSIRFAYITFKDMEHAELVMRALNMKSGYRYCVAKCDRIATCCCPKERDRLKDRLFYDEWLECDVACEPDEIIWENLGVSE
jgi:hypothetical protein